MPEDQDIQENHENSQASSSQKGTGSANKQARQNVHGGTVQLNDDFSIHLDKPLPTFDNKVAKAYAAVDRGRENKAYYALICGKNWIPRFSQIKAVKNVKSSNIVNLVSHGIVRFPDGHQYYSFVYEQGVGNRLAKNPHGIGLGWKEEIVRKKVILPLLTFIEAAQNVGLYHGAINTCNIFSGQLEDDGVILGDCLSAPPSSLQPTIFEPIDRAMASPQGRGRGSVEDDLYSLGVVIATALRTKDPLQGLDDFDIIRRKVAQGSYIALTGADRFTGSVLELLRGLLADDKRQRWSLEEVISWMDGRRLPPKQGMRVRRSGRPIVINNNKVFSVKPLVTEMLVYPEEAFKLIEDHSIERWIHRSLEDTILAKELDKAIDSARAFGRGGDYVDRLVSRTCIVLDHDLPINYKDVNVHPEGYGNALAHAYANKTDIQCFAEMITQQTFSFWAQIVEPTQGEAMNSLTKLDACRGLLAQSRMGYGLERCMYFLDSDAPCMSPMFEKHYVLSVEHLLGALDDLAKAGNLPRKIMDRHVMAFIGAKEPRCLEANVVDLNVNNEIVSTMATLRCLTELQRNMKGVLLPNLSAWMVDSLKPVYERYRNRDLRKELEKKLKKVRSSGELVKILAVLEGGNVVAKDKTLFARAKIEYAHLVAEKNYLNARLNSRFRFGLRTGREWSAVISGLIGIIIIVGFVVVHLMGGS